jgi:hypothetical protein
MRYVFPIGLFFDAVIKRGGPAGEFPNRSVFDTPATFGIVVSLRDTFLNALLEPIPLLFGRFGFHLPEDYRSVTA